MSVKISELPILDSLADNDVIAGVDTSANVTSKIEMATLKNYIDTNTQYTAGTNIDITNNVISAPNVYNKTETDGLIDNLETSVNEQLEEKDEQIEELQNEVDSLSTIFNAFPTESGEGESVTLDDTAEVKFKKFDLKGNTSQTQYTGINLFSADAPSKTQNGITVTNNGDGTFTISGTATNNVAISLTTGSKGEELTGSQAYTMAMEILSNGGSGGSLTVEILKNGTQQYNFFNIYPQTTTGMKVQVSTPSEDATIRGIAYYCGSGTVVNNLKIRPYLVKGSYTTSTIPPFEPYVGGTTSPNPSYPQPVNVVSGDNEINVLGKNLIPTSDIISTSGTTSNGITFTRNSDGSITANGTATGAISIYINNDYTELSAGTYTFSDSVASGESETTFFLYVDVRHTDGTGWDYYNFSTANTTTGMTQTIPEAFKFKTRIVIRNGQTLNNVVFKPMLEVGSSATTYEAYQGNTYNIDLPEGMELCKIGNYQDYFYKDSGKWYLHKEIGKVVLNGSETGWSDVGGNAPYKYTSGLFPNFAKNETLLSNYYECKKWDDSWSLFNYLVVATYNQNAIQFRNVDISSLEDFKIWLGNNNVTLYYVLKEATTTEITYQPLIDQLNLLEKAMSKDGKTNISQVNNDLPFVISASALKEWSV